MNSHKITHHNNLNHLLENNVKLYTLNFNCSAVKMKMAYSFSVIFDRIVKSLFTSGC